MGYLVDYVKWRGEITIENSPFNVFDSMVISALSYIRFEGTVTSEETLSIVEAVARIRKIKEPVFATCDWAMQKKAYKELLDAIIESKRFSSLLLSHYEDNTDEKDTTQFGAMTFTFPNGEIALGFRGTDETIVGWKENAQLSFMKASAQKKAAEYALRQAKEGKPFFLCGHSKGGNLALCGAIALSEEELPLLQHLYLLDSPGLCPEVFGKVDLSPLDDKTTFIVPAYDVVGQFFPMGFKHTHIIQSDAMGVLQHAFLAWRIDGGSFIEKKGYSPECEWVNKMVRDWLVDVTLDERKQFVADIFGAMTKHGEKTIWDLGKNPTRTMDRLVLSYIGAGRNERKTVAKLGFAAFFGASFREVIHLKSFPEFLISNLTQAIALITVGLLLALMPDSLPWIVVAIVSALLVLTWVVAIYYLVKSKGDWRLYQLRIAVVVMASLAYAGLAVLGYNVINSLFTWAAGMLFLFLAVIIGISLRQTDGKRIYRRVVNFIEVTLYTLIGMFLLFAPQSILGYGIFVTGIVMMVDGIYKLIR